MPAHFKSKNENSQDGIRHHRSSNISPVNKYAHNMSTHSSKAALVTGMFSKKNKPSELKKFSIASAHSSLLEY